MLVSHTNATDVNQKRLELFSLVAKRTLTTLVGQCDDEVLINLKDNKALTDLTNNLDTILVHKLRTKFKI